MSNDRFDRILKENLESLRPAYHPSAWQRFRKKLPPAGVWPVIQQYGGWIMAAAMLAGWLLTLGALNENQRLLADLSKTISQYQQNNLDTQNNRNKTNARSIVKSDTIYIVRQKIIEHRYTVNPSPAEPASSYMPAILSRSTAEIAQQKDTSGYTYSEENQAKKQIEDNKDDLLSTKEAFLQTVAELQNSLAAISTDSLEVTADQDAMIAMLDSNGITHAYKYKILAALTDSLISKQKTVASRRVQKKPFRLAMLLPRVGMESLLTENSYGIGPAVEFFPSLNLGISIGIHASTLEAENHKALRDYNSATGKLFVTQYRSYLPQKFDKIEDISIRTSVISLPVNLKYYLPLKRDLSLIVQSGTSLDISAYQQVEFESYLNNIKRRNTFETDARAYFFHNLMFGAGIQYRHSRVLAQLSPYFVYDFRNIENTPGGSNLGVRASLWVNLFK